MLSTIAWTNRGTGANDTDGLNALFGAGATQARLLVDRAVLDWEEVIVNLNYNGGGNTFNLTVQTAGISAIADSQIMGVNAGKPTSGRIRVQNNAATHYLDPTAGDDAEFDDNITNAFTGYAINPAISGTDFYATVLHELGHILGFTTNRTDLLLDNFLTDTGIDDPNDANPTGGNLFSVNIGGGPIEATFTESDTGHLWEGPGTVATNNAGLPFHVDVLMNPGRAINSNERNLISDFEATLLRDVYGYTITLPSTLNNMLVNPNFTSDVLTVVGQPGNTNDLIIVQGTGIPGQLQVSVTTVGGGPTYTEIVPLSQTNSIIVNSGGGNDINRLEYNGGRSTTINGGDGDDVFDFAFGTRQLSNITGNTILNGGAGFNQVFAYDISNAAADTFTVTSARFDRPGWGGFFYDSTVNHVTLTTGSAANTVNVESTGPGQGVVLASAGGADTVNIGSSLFGVQFIRGDIQVQNDPNFTLININDGPSAIGRTIAIDQWDGNFGAIGGLAPAYITWDRADVQTLNITTSSAEDNISLLRTSENINFYNTNIFNARDGLVIGNDTNGMQSITGAVYVGNSPGLAFTNITLKDTANTVGRDAVWTRVDSGGQLIYQIAGLAPAPISYSYQDVVLLEVLGGSGGDSYTFNGFDDDWGDTHINGGGGFNSLTVDDRNMLWTPNIADIESDSIHRGIFVSYGAQDIYFTNIQSPTYYAKNTTTTINVYGVSNSIPNTHQLTVISGSGNDTLNLYPHVFLTGELSINGNFGYSGGTGIDTVLVYDVDTALPINYTFYNQFGPGTTNIGGLGAAGFGAGSDVENIVVSAGGGDDTFDINTFQSGSALAINGGGGDDVLNFGSSSLAGITNMASFNFNGQEGTDWFNLNNGGANDTWTYNRGLGSITAGSNLGAFYTLSESNVEVMQLFSGAQADSFYMNAVAAGTRMFIYAGGGVDGLAFGAFSNNVESIQGPVAYYGEAGGGHVAVYDTADTSGDTFHVEQYDFLGSLEYYIGLHPGDNLFGPGGSLYATGLTNYLDGIGVRFNLGSGADTIYAQPLSEAVVSINANNPTTAPGDTLNLALAQAQDYLVSGSSSGNVTSSNLQTLYWTGIEIPFGVDDVAPAVIAQGYEEVPESRIYVQFNEDVSSQLDVAYLYLYNTTLLDYVPFGVMSLVYDGGTNTAYFTFPGYANGRLPGGDYEAAITGSLTDNFGNPLGAETLLTFTVEPPLPGDYDLDNTVGPADYDVWKADFGDAVTIAGAMADGNGDGIVNAADYTVWRDHLGTTRGGGAAAMTLKAPADPVARGMVESTVEEAAAKVEFRELRSSFVASLPTVGPRLDTEATRGANRRDDALLAWLTARDGQRPDDEAARSVARGGEINDAAGSVSGAIGRPIGASRLSGIDAVFAIAVDRGWRS